MSREESRELTREKLLRSAAELFAERGLAGTSVEQIVERAGFTRGAFYGNFDGKHELVLALLEKRTERELEELRALGRDAGSFEGMVEQFRAWHRERDRHLASWLVLRTELWLYGLRNPGVLPTLTDREARTRTIIAEALARDFTSRDASPPAPVEVLALIVHALDDGLAIQRVLSPESSPDDAAVDAVDLLLRSWVALGREIAAEKGND
ncbi:transcriptional regulator, TetR family [Frankia casuarinae]|uniref:Transcriptional regulator, TetR family n=1 Tax=Frankia casuarinae (strain DSM 45818 / CECT 9043 / HFP020203 / CcI3) TaxID=106370 RepID=Q2JDZ6_FRACC|nr:MULTISPECIES: TetR/AcrR family transcriptional regulator [Frankia]ABD10496.1 transcriptional regulator, TetR family [Frankia casuarinae]ESZ99886.1 transcriptional regulator, TetR family [Frankia sp. CcI6]EYT89735.1 transcriptional regulator, TetR family [Frankia casuarinae]KDA40833.1 transcriptional regulator, TetR family [Frankia sp. BMG5.23]KEZ34383.1 transcriptional regulator, TetR family [Frankia sp. CeD]